MRILVTGSRDWDDTETVWRNLHRVIEDNPDQREFAVVHGHCPTGADHLADEWVPFIQTWAEYAGKVVTVERHPADWNRLGKRAGFVRNAEMVNLGADVCLAFIKNGSRGATHTADLAEKAGIPVRRFLA